MTFKHLGLISEQIQENYRFPPGRWWLSNNVQSLNGSFSGGGQNSDALSNRIDRTILHTIREACDAVVIGAQTAREESIPAGPQPLAIVTQSGDMSGHRLLLAPGTRLVFLGPESALPALEDTFRAPPGVQTDFQLLPECTDTWGEQIAAAALRLGWQKVVCEGGPRLIETLLAAGVLDELCITFSGSLLPDGNGLRPAAGVQLQLRQALLDQRGNIYTRWLIEKS